MDIKTFKESLDNIFPPSEPEALVKSGTNPIADFKAGVNARLRGVKKAYNPPGHQEVMPSDKPGDAVMDERENPISVKTMQDQVKNWGPKGVSEIIARMCADMDKQDVNGNPSSEFGQFIDSVKQDGISLIIKVGSQSGGVKVPPNGVQPITPGERPEDPNKKPGDELASL